MLETSARLLRLLGLLQSGRGWPGTELAAKLGVSPRTLRRDIDKLRTLDYRIESFGGLGGGYLLAACSTVPPMLLDDDEAVAVAISLRTATASATTDIAETALRALAKLDQLMPSRLRHRLRPFDAVVSAPVPGPTVDPAALAEIAGAIRDLRRLRFGYVVDGTESRREVEPYRLIHRGRRWYLLGWDLARQDWRTFRADRIGTERAIGQRFVARPLPSDDIAAYVGRRVGSGSFRYAAVLTMVGTAEDVVAEVPPSLGRVEAIDDSTCRLWIGSDDLDHLAVWIAAFGFEFTIHEPPELIERARVLAGRLARATGGQPISLRTDEARRPDSPPRDR